MIFQKYSLKDPILEQVRSMQLQGKKHLNLTESKEDGKLQVYLPEKIKELLLIKNESFYLGKTIPCGNSPKFPTDVICFKLNANAEINQGLYITIIGKDLDFIYTTKTKINDFWDQTSIKKYPYSSTEDRPISFRPFELDDGNKPISLPSHIISRLRETSNLVFINPDSFI